MLEYVSSDGPQPMSSALLRFFVVVGTVES